MPDRMNLQGKTSLITGAAGGIGRAISVSLAKRGARLVISDIDESGLAETARLAREAGASSVVTQRLDVGDRAAITAFAAAFTKEHHCLDVLVNNAGVAVGGDFEQVSEEDFEWLFEINFWGVVRMTRAFLPLLHQSTDARIVNLSSVFGIIAPPGQAAYCASKFAVRGFSEALRHELAKSTIGVSVVHPGGVATSISDNARIPKGAAAEEVERKRKAFKKQLTLAPDVAGETIVRGIEARRARILVGNDARILSVIERVAPVSYWKLLSRGAPV